MSRVYLSFLAQPQLKKYLYDAGHEIVTVEKNGYVYDQVCTHPDIFFCKMGACAEARLIKAEASELGYKYPQNIAFNAVCLDKYFVHSLKYTAARVLALAKDMGLELINVEQGYTKCSTVVVDGHSIITADMGINKKLSAIHDVDVLAVKPGYVKLSGFEEGFLGGASGRVGDEIIFNGDLSMHPDFKQICDFITSRGLKVHWFPETELEDIGSIIESSCFI